MFGGIDHIGVAVADLDAAIAVHRDTYGMPLVHRETIAEQGVEAALLDVGESHVELLAPLGDDTPVGRFLASRGPGLHHVAYRVEDVAAALEELRAAGLRLIDEAPRTGIRGSRVAFLHPSASGGVLTELVQPAAAEPAREPVTSAPARGGAGRVTAGPIPASPDGEQGPAGRVTAGPIPASPDGEWGPA